MLYVLDVKNKICTYIIHEIKIFFSSRLCAPFKKLLFHQHKFTLKRVFWSLFLFFSLPKRRCDEENIIFLVCQSFFSRWNKICDLRCRMNFPPFYSLFFSASLSDFLSICFSSTKCVFVSFLDEESFSPSLSCLE
jgi:hypothetical protein